MDPAAVNFNVTVDDFDSVITFQDETQWTTPNPQLNLPFDPTKSPYLYGTYHLTSVTSASLTFNFDGPGVYIYGASGPDYGSYEVNIDGNALRKSAHATANTTFPHLIYSNTTLSNSRHTLKLSNLGALDGDNGANKFLFDYLQATVQLGPAGAAVMNTTLEETDSKLVYNGTWVTNLPNPNFSGGGSKYTHVDGSAVSMSFHGSALYIFGDVVNDHGLFAVTLDNNPQEVFSGMAGCGGAFGKLCEKTNTLAYFAGNLDDKLHNVTVRNIGGPNNSFFDLDSFVYTTPSKYSPILSSASSGALPSSSTGLPSQSTGAGTVLYIPNIVLLALITMVLSSLSVHR